MKYYVLEDKNEDTLQRQIMVIKEIYDEIGFINDENFSLEDFKPGDTLIFRDLGCFIKRFGDSTDAWSLFNSIGINVEFTKTPGYNFEYILSQAKTLKVNDSAMFEYCVDTYHKNNEGDKEYRVASHNLSKKQGKQYGRVLGSTVTFSIEEKAKTIIKTRSRDFGGDLNDADCQKLAGCSRNSFYKYKRELKGKT